MKKVLFVCLGNICRSPTAQGVFEKLLRERQLESDFDVDSAGTHGYHIGSPPDPRAIETAAHRGIDLSPLRGRQATAADIELFDYVIAMDKSNHQHLVSIASSSHEHKVRLFMEFADEYDVDEVPDPYYGGGSGFDRVLDMIEAASQGLLEEILRNR